MITEGYNKASTFVNYKNHHGGPAGTQNYGRLFT
jgi:hypothetical protein